MRKIAVFSLTIIMLISACKKNNPQPSPQLTAHFMFKPGTYWVYNGNAPGNALYVDSQYVTATGSLNGLPYMQISDVVKDVNADTVCSAKTLYIGIGPAGNQLQIWGYGYNGGDAPQVIFEADTPVIGNAIAQACIFSNIDALDNQDPYNIPITPTHWVIEYYLSNKNQEYGDANYYFCPDYGIVQKTENNTPYGAVAYWEIIRFHIIH
jgi:hypothetical protein